MWRHSWSKIVVRPGSTVNHVGNLERWELDASAGCTLALADQFWVSPTEATA